MEQLRDIKPYIDSSDWLYSAFILVAVLFGVVLLFLLYRMVRFFVTKYSKNQRREYLGILQNLDKNSPKEFAYKATYYGRILANDTRGRELFSQFEERLEKYKYKKTAPKLDEETLQYYELFLEVIHV